MCGERGVDAPHILAAENTPGFWDLFWPGWGTGEMRGLSAQRQTVRLSVASVEMTMFG